MIKLTPNQNPVANEALFLKSYRVDAEEESAIKQGMHAIEFLMELVKARGQTEHAETLEYHRDVLSEMLDCLDDIEATKTDICLN